MSGSSPFEPVGERLGTAPRDMLEALLTSVADAIYVVDPEGRVEFANPAALELLGYREQELLGLPSHQTIHHHHWDGTPFPAEECPMLRPHTTGETVRADGDTFWRKDGSKFRVAYSSAPLAMASGRGAVVVFRDVTLRIAAEEALRREAVERARAEEIHASRARIVEAADAERRRLVRDLHDGAQQRLIRILLALRRAGDAADAAVRHAAPEADAADPAVRHAAPEADAADPAVRDAADGVRELLDEAAAETQAAIAELRDLGSGIHPQILTNRGVAAAVESLTGPLPLVVRLAIPEHRWPPAIEAAAYFVIAEALTNVVKHADATSATVTVGEHDGELRIEVADDGRGGATVAAGRGLAGAQDRVAALGGALTLASASGDGDSGGTLLRVTLPLPGDAPPS